MTYSGKYTTAFEVSWFEPDGTKEIWWASGALPTRDTPNGYEECSFQLVVRGKLSPMGQHGHLGMCERELDVEEVLTCKRLKAQEQT